MTLAARSRRAALRRTPTCARAEAISRVEATCAGGRCRPCSGGDTCGSGAEDCLTCADLGPCGKCPSCACLLARSTLDIDTCTDDGPRRYHDHAAPRAAGRRVQAGHGVLRGPLPERRMRVLAGRHGVAPERRPLLLGRLQHVGGRVAEHMRRAGGLWLHDTSDRLLRRNLHVGARLRLRGSRRRQLPRRLGLLRGRHALHLGDVRMTPAPVAAVAVLMPLSCGGSGGDASSAGNGRVATPAPASDVSDSRGGYFSCGGNVCSRAVQVCMGGSEGEKAGACLVYSDLQASTGASCGPCPTCACLLAGPTIRTCADDDDGGTTLTELLEAPEAPRAITTASACRTCAPAARARACPPEPPWATRASSTAAAPATG